MTYAKAGVSIEAGDEPVRRIGPLARKTNVPGVLAGVGGFSALFDLANGFSLARKVLFELAGWTVDRRRPALGRTLGEELLEPTRIYVKIVRSLFAKFPIKGATLPAEEFRAIYPVFCRKAEERGSIGGVGPRLPYLA